MIESRPFTLIGDQMALELEQKLSASLKSLYGGWISKSKNVKFFIENKNKPLIIDSKDWQVIGNSSSLWVAFKRGDDLESKVLKELFELDEYVNFRGTALTSNIYQDFIQSTTNAIFDLADEVHQEGGKAEHVFSSFGSGAVLGSVKLGQVEMPIAISGSIVMRISNDAKKATKTLNPAPKLTQREMVLDRLESQLEVVAGKVSISFGDLSKMEVGDVIILDSKVGEPLSAHFSDGVKASVQLCKVEDKKAIQFIE